MLTHIKITQQSLFFYDLPKFKQTVPYFFLLFLVLYLMKID